jgi:ATP-dependent helicase/nuclease subunit B
MRIVFGWNLDRAPWSTSAGATTVVTGPLGLLGILQTRLGTTRPTVERPVRIAQYRSLLAQADHPWYRRSFANDPMEHRPPPPAAARRRDRSRMAPDN